MRRIAAAYFIALTACLTAFGAAGSTSMPSFWRYAHPEAKALVGIEWQRIANSAIGQEVRQKLAEGGAASLEGAELADRVSRVFISSPGNPAAGGDEQPPAVVAVQGSFDLAKIRELAAAKLSGTSDYQSTEILLSEEAGKRPTAIALVSQQLLLLGDLNSVESAIDNYNAGDPSQATNPLFIRAAQLSATNDIWIVAAATPSDFSKDGFQQAPFLNDVDSIEAGVSLQDGLGIELNLGTTTPESAAQLASGLQMMLGMMLASQQQKPGMPNLTDKLEIATEDARVRLALSLDREEFESGFRRLAGAGLGGGTGQADEVRTQAKIGSSGEWNWGDSQPRVQPRPEPRKQVIKIWGLEDGPKEIPLGR